ncbi:MAG: hypothetical protein F6K14_31330 [Symploca sp. SIO2C1]|nr:hypothetical protein [Symploca sp. SIO2C1]
MDDIVTARNSIVGKGVSVDPVCATSPSTPNIVLAFFCDPDGNNLALRQDNYVPTVVLPICGPPKCNNCP